MEGSGTTAQSEAAQSEADAPKAQGLRVVIPAREVAPPPGRPARAPRVVLPSKNKKRINSAAIGGGTSRAADALDFLLFIELRPANAGLSRSSSNAMKGKNASKGKVGKDDLEPATPSVMNDPTRAARRYQRQGTKRSDRMRAERRSKALDFLLTIDLGVPRLFPGLESLPAVGMRGETRSPRNFSVLLQASSGYEVVNNKQIPVLQRVMRTSVLSKALCNCQLIFRGENQLGPLGVCSVLGYREEADDEAGGASSMNNSWVHSARGSSAPSYKAVSYAHLMDAMWISAVDGTTVYRANFLDNPQLQHGRERTILNLFGCVASVIPYVHPEALKVELDQQFKENHESWGIHPSITISSIRRIKASLLQIAREEDMEMAAVATAYVYIEKLILEKSVTGVDLEGVGACCLVLAEKFVGDRSEIRQRDWEGVFEALGKEFGISVDQLIRIEFEVYVLMKFNLHVQADELLPHLKKIFKELEITSKQYGCLERVVEYLPDATMSEFSLDDDDVDDDARGLQTSSVLTDDGTRDCAVNP